MLYMIYHFKLFFFCHQVTLLVKLINQVLTQHQAKLHVLEIELAFSCFLLVAYGYFTFSNNFF